MFTSSFFTLWTCHTFRFIITHMESGWEMKLKMLLSYFFCTFSDLCWLEFVEYRLQKQHKVFKFHFFLFFFTQNIIKVCILKPESDPIDAVYGCAWTMWRQVDVKVEDILQIESSGQFETLTFDLHGAFKHMFTSSFWTLTSDWRKHSSSSSLQRLEGCWSEQLLGFTSGHCRLSVVASGTLMPHVASSTIV